MPITTWVMLKSASADGHEGLAFCQVSGMYHAVARLRVSRDSATEQQHHQADKVTSTKGFCSIYFAGALHLEQLSAH